MEKINLLFVQDPYRYGVPKREYGSIVFGSFNTRNLGAKKQRADATWQFLAQICQNFGLLSVQEIMEDLEDVNYLQALMGENFGAVISDISNAFPSQAF